MTTGELFQRHRRLHVVQFDDVMKVNDASVRQVPVHDRTLEQFSGLKIVVDVFEITNGVENEVNRLSGDSVSDVRLQFAATKKVYEEFSVRRGVVFVCGY